MYHSKYKTFNTKKIQYFNFSNGSVINIIFQYNFFILSILCFPNS